MILAFHLIWTNYGFWFPNDPRGSWSREVWSPQLEGLGPIHRGPKHDRPGRGELAAWLAEAQRRLKFPPVTLASADFAVVSRAIQDVCQRRELTAWALAILPEHVNIVVRRAAIPYERMVNALKGVSSRDLRRHWAWPTRKPPRPVWAGGYWVRYLDNPRAIRAAIQYVESNPAKDGLPRQRWLFIRRYVETPRRTRRG